MKNYFDREASPDAKLKSISVGINQSKTLAEKVLELIRKTKNLSPQIKKLFEPNNELGYWLHNDIYKASRMLQIFFEVSKQLNLGNPPKQENRLFPFTLQPTNTVATAPTILTKTQKSNNTATASPFGIDEAFELLGKINRQPDILRPSVELATTDNSVQTYEHKVVIDENSYNIRTSYDPLGFPPSRIMTFYLTKNDNPKEEALGFKFAIISSGAIRNNKSRDEIKFRPVQYNGTINDIVVNKSAQILIVSDLIQKLLASNTNENAPLKHKIATRQNVPPLEGLNDKPPTTTKHRAPQKQTNDAYPDENSDPITTSKLSSTVKLLPRQPNNL